MSSSNAFAPPSVCLLSYMLIPVSHSPSSPSHLSPKAKSASPSSSFNPFSPLSPHVNNRDLEEGDDNYVHASRGAYQSARLIYSRVELLRIAKHLQMERLAPPAAFKPLSEWYGCVCLVMHWTDFSDTRSVSSSKSPSAQGLEDPAVVSVGLPNRRAGGYNEGFGHGGGLATRGMEIGRAHV